MKRKTITSFVFFSLFILLLFSCARAAAAPVDVVILLDRSGSMRDTNDKRDIAPILAQYIIDQTFFQNESSRAAVIVFGKTTNVIPSKGLSSNYPELLNRLKNPGPFENWTDVEAAFSEAQKLLLSSPSDRKKIIVLITDGMPDVDPATAKARYPELKNATRINTAYEGKGDTRSAGYFSMQRLVRTVLPALRQSNVTVYAVAPGSSSLAYFLEELSMAANGSKEYFKIISKNEQLVSEAQKIIPPQENTIVLYDKEFSGGSGNLSVPVPLKTWIRKIRGTVIMLGEYGNSMQIKFKSEKMPSIAPDENVDAYLQVRDKGNKHVFTRLITGTGGFNGEGSYLLSFDSVFNEYPAYRFVVEAVTDLHLDVALNPETPSEGAPTKIAVALLDNRMNRLGLTGATGKLVGPDGITQMIGFGVDDKGVAKSTFTAPEGKAGDYYLVVTGFIEGLDGAYIRTSYRFRIGPAVPLYIKVGIPTKTKSSSQKSGTFAFPPLGLSDREYEIKNIKIETDSPRVTQIKITLDPLIPSVPEGEVLDPEKWIEILPSNRLSISKNRPATFTLKAHLPMMFPSSLKNGIYKGRLRIESPEIQTTQDFPAEFDVELPISVPELKVPAEIRIHNVWHVPGSKRIEIPIQTDAAYNITAEVASISTIEKISDDGESTVPLDEKLIELMIKEGKIKINRDSNGAFMAYFKYGSIEPGTYKAEVYFSSANARPGKTTIYFTVPKTTISSYVRIALLIIFAILIPMTLFGINSWRRIRRLVSGSAESIYLPEGIGPDRPSAINRLLRLTPVRDDKGTSIIGYGISGPGTIVQGRPTMDNRPARSDARIRTGSIIRVDDYTIQINHIGKPDKQGATQLSYVITSSPNRRTLRFVSISLVALCIFAGIILILTFLPLPY